MCEGFSDICLCRGCSLDLEEFADWKLAPGLGIRIPISLCPPKTSVRKSGCLSFGQRVRFCLSPDFDYSWFMQLVYACSSAEALMKSDPDGCNKPQEILN